jgi:hypothetical protein
MNTDLEESVPRYCCKMQHCVEKYTVTDTTVGNSLVTVLYIIRISEFISISEKV